MNRRLRRALAATALVTTASTFTTVGVAGADSSSRRPTIAALASSSPDLSILVQAVTKAGLADTLNQPGRYTVFAPNNAAFTQLLQQLGFANLDAVPVDALKAILLDHVVQDRLNSNELIRADRRDRIATALGGLRLEFDRSPNVQVNDVNVLAADLKASNGIVHVIGAVLLDPDPRPTIAEIAVGNPNFSTLVAAAQRAGLVDVLSQPGNLTVFAPTNDAFAALLRQLNLTSLDQVPTDQLRSILLDHVVGAEVDAVDVGELVNGHQRVRTLGGLRLRFTGSPLKVNGVGISAVDVEAENGTVHVIDAVLLRPAH
jgi:uncharacterized surface protein with fasciclin (FAS1) repeats